MSSPIEYQILLNVQAALRAVAVADGYYHDIEEAAVKLDPDVDVEELLRAGGIRPFIYLQPLPEEWLYVGSPNGLELRWPLKVHWVNQTDDPTDDSARAKAFFEGCADVERAITRDISRGGLAMDHRIMARNFNVSENGTQVWAEIDTLIRVHRVYGRP